MRTAGAAALLLALAACEDLPPEATPEEMRVEDAFHAWLDALAAGDAATSWRLLSEGNRSQWLFDLLQAEDRTAHAWRLKLQGQTRTDVDLWYSFHKDRKIDRVARLPTSLLDDPSVYAVWKTTFDAQRENIRQEMSKIKVTKVYTDGSNATVTVLNAVSKPEMFQLVIERGGWKIDHHKEGVSPRTR